MPGKPYQSILIPYEDEIFTLRKQRPPVAFAAIAELLKQKYQISIQRAAICKFVKVRARWRKKEARENRTAARTWSALGGGAHPHSARAGPRTENAGPPPVSPGIENRRPTACFPGMRS
ncbi:MAG: hypothetical protein ACRD2L_06080 [Terriglobia bacterium]